MRAFFSSLSRPFDYAAKATDDFNEWIRFEIPHYQTWAPISAIFELPVTDKSQIRKDPDQFRSRTTSAVYLKQTTGSTGPPIQFAYSPFFHQETVLLAVPKIAYRLGLAPNANNGLYSLTVRDKPAEAPFARFDSSGYGGTAIRVGVDTGSPQAILQMLENATAFRPFCISSGPTVLAAIAEVTTSDVARRL